MPQREDPDQDRADDERRHRDAEDGDQHRGPVGDRVVARGRGHAERHAKANRQHHRQQPDSRRDREQIGDDLADRASLAAVRRSEVEPRNHPDEVVDVLLPERPVETVLLVQLCHRLRRDRLFPVPRSPRRQMVQRKRQRVDDEPDRQQNQDAADEVSGHARAGSAVSGDRPTSSGAASAPAPEQVRTHEDTA
jgi:hypothetical protein